MNCINCGSPIQEGDLFCTKCGTPAPTEKRCPNCQVLLAEDDLFCGKCGTRIDGNQSEPVSGYQPSTQQNYQPVTQQSYQPQSKPNYMPPNQNFGGNWSAPKNNYQQPQNNYQNSQNGSYGAQPQKYQMISKYVGEPTVGIAKATGTFAVYSDHLEFTKHMGNSFTSMFGAVGMVAAASKAKRDGGKVEYYAFQDIQTAYVGKYAGLMPAVVLVMNDGQVFSFVGTFSNQSAANVVNTILYNK